MEDSTFVQFSYWDLFFISIGKKLLGCFLKLFSKTKLVTKPMRKCGNLMRKWGWVEEEGEEEEKQNLKVNLHFLCESISR